MVRRTYGRRLEPWSSACATRTSSCDVCRRAIRRVWRRGSSGIWKRSPCRALAERGLYSRSRDLVRFAEWCRERDIATPAEVTKPILERFQRHLFHYRKRDGGPLAINRQRIWIAHLQGLFRWLAKHNHILFNPASDLDLPRMPRGHLRDPLSVDEVERVLALPDVNVPRGLRDRAMLEVLYATGIRRMELANLAVDALNLDRGTLFVRRRQGRQGPAGADRRARPGVGARSTTTTRARCL